jgi:hypothetical protein
MKEPFQLQGPVGDTSKPANIPSDYSAKRNGLEEILDNVFEFSP